MASTFNRIQLAGDYRYEEDPAVAGITPGHLVELAATGVQVHATEGGVAEKAWAVESPLQGKTAFSVEGRDIDDAYVAGEVVSYHIAVPGASVFAFIKAAENIAKGDKLVSGGDGTLIATAGVASAANPENVMAIAEEALDLTATGAVDTRLKVRVV